MGLYRFHLENGSLPDGDATDQQLADDEAALKEATAAAAEALRDEFWAGASAIRVKVLVKDEAGRAVGTVSVEGSIER